MTDEVRVRRSTLPSTAADVPNPADVLQQLEALISPAWRAWAELHHALKALSVAPFPGSKWPAALRPCREALGKFVMELRAARQAYQQVAGRVPEHLDRIEADALFVRRRLSWVGREAAKATSKEEMDDWLSQVEALRDLVADVARETKLAWRVFGQMHRAADSNDDCLG